MRGDYRTQKAARAAAARARRHNKERPIRVVRQRDGPGYNVSGPNNLRFSPIGKNRWT